MRQLVGLSWMNDHVLEHIELRRVEVGGVGDDDVGVFDAQEVRVGERGIALGNQVPFAFAKDAVFLVVVPSAYFAKVLALPVFLPARQASQYSCCEGTRLIEYSLAYTDFCACACALLTTEKSKSVKAWIFERLGEQKSTYNRHSDPSNRPCRRTFLVLMPPHIWPLAMLVRAVVVVPMPLMVLVVTAICPLTR